MFQYRAAAVVSVLVGVLDVLLLLLAIGAGVLEGLSGSLAPTVAFNASASLSYLLTIFVYLALRKYLRPTGIVWPVLTLITLCILGIVLAVLESAAALSDAILLIVHSVSLVPYGLALLALSVRLLQVRRRHRSLAPLYGFAVCNILTAALTITVILAPLAYAPAVLSSFLLAGAFFRIARGPDADTRSSAPGTLPPASLYVFIIVSAGLLALLVMEFAKIYQLPWRLTGHPVWLEPTVAGLAALQAIGLAVLLYRYFSARSTAVSLNWVAAGMGAWLCYLVTQHWLVTRLDSRLQRMLAGIVLGNGASVFFSVAIGAAWFYVFITLTDDRASLNGYRRPFLVGSFTVAAGYMLAFPDTLRLIGLAAICAVAIGLSLSVRAKKTTAFVLGRWKQAVVMSVTLALPTAAYLAYHAHDARTLKAAGIILSNLLSTERTAMLRVSEDTDPTSFIPPHASLVSTTPVFDDVWFVDDRQGYAVDDEHLYSRDVDTAPWRPVRELSTTDNLVRFDESGQRGWIGPPWGPVEITEDGGATWRVMDPYSVFEDLAGREFGSNLLDDQSRLYLDPATGDGAFVMGCRHFRTDDFARSWRMSEFKRKNGKRLCVAESPFTLNDTSTALIGITLGTDVFYRRETENGQWEAVCAVEGAALFMVPTATCADDDTLSADDRQFLSRHENEWAMLQIEPVPQDVRHAVLHGHVLPEDPLQELVRRNSARYWLVDHGALMRRDRGSATWIVEAHVPNLVRVIPLSETEAIGWDLTLQIYASDDGGSVWRPVSVLGTEVPDDYVIHVQPDPLQRGLWVLSSQGLHFLAYETRQPRRFLKAGDGESLIMFGTSPSGATVWVYAEEGNRLRLSSDRGETWRVIDVTGHAATSDGYVPLVHAACLDSGRCYLVFDDGAVTETTGEHAHRPVGALPEDVAANGGYLMAENSRQVLVFIEAWGSHAYRSLDQGKSWHRVSLGVESYWSTPERFRTAGSHILPGEDKAVIMPRLHDPWVAINPWNWDEDMNLCWDAKTETLYLFNDENLAVSFDAGKSWRRNRERLRNPPFCGINNGFLWLNYQGMRVFRLAAPQAEPHGTLTATE